MNEEKIDSYIHQAHANAKEKGFWEESRNIGEVLMIVVSELGEAFSAHRKGRLADWTGFNRMAGLDTDVDKAENAFLFENHIKDTFEDKLADVCIRVFDLMGQLSFKAHNSKDWAFIETSNVGQSLLETTGLLVCLYDELESDSRFAAQKSFEYLIKNLLQIAAHHKIDLHRHIEAKMAYTRPRLHEKNIEP